MNDTKNILIAWLSSLTSLFAFIDASMWITIASAIVLPVVFFTLGKTVDVLLQIYLNKRQKLGTQAACLHDKKGGTNAEDS